MSNLALTTAAMPGAPIGFLVINLVPALAPVGLGLLVLAVLGAIVLLLGRDAHHPARGARSRRPRRAEHPTWLRSSAPARHVLEPRPAVLWQLACAAGTRGGGGPVRWAG